MPQDVGGGDCEHTPYLQARKKIHVGASAQGTTFHNKPDNLPVLLKDCTFMKVQCGVPLKALDTTRSSVSFSEVLTSVFRPTERAAPYGHTACCGMPLSFAKNVEPPQASKSGEDDVTVSGDTHSKLSASMRFDVAIVPQKEWDQLFEMALQAASSRIVTTDNQNGPYSF